MTDAHCHPRDLLEYHEDAEEERRETGTAIAANSCSREEFEYIEGLSGKAKEDGVPPVFRCFALHPQLSAHYPENVPAADLELLQTLASEGRVDAIGETGFDLYDERYRAAEKIQDEMFACHLETALRYSLPIILHVRRAMHKVFPFAKELKKLPAVVFHSWPGTKGEGEALLRRGINAYFSFGTTVLKNHREAMVSAAHFPAERILLETDAPYQPLRGKAFSSWRDLEAICSGIASFRKDAGYGSGSSAELEELTTANFYQVFSG